MIKEHYYKISSFEKNNWWYKARRDLLNKILSTSQLSFKNILDAGCGVGSNFDVLKKYSPNIYGVDVSKDAINFCKNKGYTKLYLSSIENFKSKIKFDLIVCMDVIEHIKDDNSAIKKLKSLLTKDGILIISVPAHNSLWNDNDILSQHYRRYQLNSIKNLLQNNNLNIIKISYWNQLLYLPSLIFYTIYKLKKKRKMKNNLSLIPDFLNYVLYYLLKIENFLFIKFKLFQGTSIICIAKKDKSHLK